MSQLTGGQTILVGGQTHGFVCPPTKKFVLNAVSTARFDTGGNRVKSDLLQTAMLDPAEI